MSLSFFLNYYYYLTMSITEWDSKKYRVIKYNHSYGAFGHISIVEEVSTKKKLVMKKIPVYEKEEMIISEVEAGQMLDHENISKFRELSETILRDHLLYFDFIEGATLFDLLTNNQLPRFSELQVKKMMNQLMEAIFYCQQKGIAHRDIKTPNIMIDNEKNLKLIDFGLCYITKKEETCEFICQKVQNYSRSSYACHRYSGSRGFSAPEVIRGRPHCPFKADVWSIGIVMYHCLFRLCPWDVALTIQIILKGEKHPNLVFPDDITVSEESKDLLKKMLCQNPHERISINQIMEHAWIKP